MSLATRKSKSTRTTEFFDTENEYNPQETTMSEGEWYVRQRLAKDLLQSSDTEKTSTPKKKREAKPSSVKFEKPMQIPLEDIGLDDHFQVRVKKNLNHVRDYKKRFLDFKKGKIDGEKINYPFDPIHVWRRDGKFVLIAGHHRYDAATEAEMEMILAVELIGDEKDALFFAVEDNKKNGLKYNYGDYTVCITKLVDIDPDISAGRLEYLTGSCRSNCGKVKKKYLDSKVSTSGQLTKPAKQEKTTSSRTKAIESEKEVFHWNILEEQSVEDQILVVSDIVERFFQKLNDKDKKDFMEMIAPLFSPPVDTLV